MNESMTCRGCGTTMTTARCESDGRMATTCWHECPTCGKVRMTSERGVYVARDARKTKAGPARLEAYERDR